MLQKVSHHQNEDQFKQNSLKLNQFIINKRQKYQIYLNL